MDANLPKLVSADEMAVHALAHSLFGSFDDATFDAALLCNCEASQLLSQRPVDFWNVADSFLSCVSLTKITTEGSLNEAEQETSSDKSKELFNKSGSAINSSVLDYVKNHKELYSTTVDECDGNSQILTAPQDEEMDEDENCYSSCSVTLDKDTEKVLMSSKALYNSTRQLHTFLKEIVPELKCENPGPLLECSEEPSFTRQIFSGSKRITHAADCFPDAEDAIESVLPNNSQSSLDRCMQMMSLNGR